MDDKEPFLARWSRRKLETKENRPAGGESAVELPPAAEASAGPANPPATVPGRSMPDTPEYREFFDPQVDERLRQTALKRLFSEPQFNVMDGLDTYIDDYSKPDPIPAAMLRQMNQAKDLFLFDDDKREGEGASDPAAGAAGGIAPAEVAEAAGSPPASASNQAADAATSTAHAAPAEAIKNA